MERRLMDAMWRQLEPLGVTGISLDLNGEGHIDLAFTDGRSHRLSMLGEITPERMVAVVTEYARAYSPEPSATEPSDVPQIDGEVVGFRTWSLRDWKLSPVAMTSTTPWEPGINTAYCAIMEQVLVGAGLPNAHAHDAPADGCECGLYALYNPDPQGAITGAILAWGEMCLHPTGFRAQYAKPILLATSDEWPRPQRAVIAALAEDYGCDVVDLAYLRDAAREHGRLVPEELCPEMQTPPPGGHSGYFASYMPLWYKSDVAGQLLRRP